MFKMKKIGVIGGIGPLSTSYFYQSLIYKCQRKNRSLYPNIIINSVDTWDFVTQQKDKETAASFLIKEIKKIEPFVDLIVIVCNTAHFVLDEVQAEINLPIIPIHKAVIKRVLDSKVKKVGVLGTKITIESGLYTNELDKLNIPYRVLDKRNSESLNKITYNEMMVRKKLTFKRKNRIKLKMVNKIKKLVKQGCDGIILGCTDYPYFINEEDTKAVKEIRGIKIFSSTDILAEEVLENL